MTRESRSGISKRRGAQSGREREERGVKHDAAWGAREEGGGALRSISDTLTHSGTFGGRGAKLP